MFIKDKSKHVLGNKVVDVKEYVWQSQNKQQPPSTSAATQPQVQPPPKSIAPCWKTGPLDQALQNCQTGFITKYLSPKCGVLKTTNHGTGMFHVDVVYLCSQHGINCKFPYCANYTRFATQAGGLPIQQVLNVGTQVNFNGRPLSASGTKAKFQATLVWPQLSKKPFNPDKISDNEMDDQLQACIRLAKGVHLDGLSIDDVDGTLPLPIGTGRPEPRVQEEEQGTFGDLDGLVDKAGSISKFLEVQLGSYPNFENQRKALRNRLMAINNDVDALENIFECLSGSNININSQKRNSIIESYKALSQSFKRPRPKSPLSETPKSVNNKLCYEKLAMDNMFETYAYGLAKSNDSCDPKEDEELKDHCQLLTEMLTRMQMPISILATEFEIYYVAKLDPDAKHVLQENWRRRLDVAGSMASRDDPVLMQPSKMVSLIWSFFSDARFFDCLPLNCFSIESLLEKTDKDGCDLPPFGYVFRAIQDMKIDAFSLNMAFTKIIKKQFSNKEDLLKTWRHECKDSLKGRFIFTITDRFCDYIFCGMLYEHWMEDKELNKCTKDFEEQLQELFNPPRCAASSPEEDSDVDAELLSIAESIVSDSSSTSGVLTKSCSSRTSDRTSFADVKPRPIGSSFRGNPVKDDASGKMTVESLMDSTFYVQYQHFANWLKEQHKQAQRYAQHPEGLLTYVKNVINVWAIPKQNCKQILELKEDFRKGFTKPTSLFASWAETVEKSSKNMDSMLSVNAVVMTTFQYCWATLPLPRIHVEGSKAYDLFKQLPYSTTIKGEGSGIYNHLGVVVHLFGGDFGVIQTNAGKVLYERNVCFDYKNMEWQRCKTQSLALKTGTLVKLHARVGKFKRNKTKMQYLFATKVWICNQPEPETGIFVQGRENYWREAHEEFEKILKFNAGLRFSMEDDNEQEYRRVFSNALRQVEGRVVPTDGAKSLVNDSSSYDQFLSFVQQSETKDVYEDVFRTTKQLLIGGVNLFRLRNDCLIYTLLSCLEGFHTKLDVMLISMLGDPSYDGRRICDIVAILCTYFQRHDKNFEDQLSEANITVHKEKQGSLSHLENAFVIINDWMLKLPSKEDLEDIKASEETGPKPTPIAQTDQETLDIKEQLDLLAQKVSELEAKMRHREMEENAVQDTNNKTIEQILRRLESLGTIESTNSAGRKVAKFVRIVSVEGAEVHEFPTDENGNLTFQSVASVYPGVNGLKYKCPERNSTRHCRQLGAIFEAPEDGWGTRLYCCNFVIGGGPPSTSAVTNGQASNINSYLLARSQNSFLTAFPPTTGGGMTRMF